MTQCDSPPFLSLHGIYLPVVFRTVLDNTLYRTYNFNKNRLKTAAEFY